MRTAAIVGAVVVLLVVAMAVFSYMLFGQRADARSKSGITPSTRIDDVGEPVVDHALRDEVRALAKRMDRLAEEVEQLRLSSGRSSVGSTTPPPQTSEAFVREHRDDVFRLLAEDRDLATMSEKIESFRHWVVIYVQDGTIPSGTPAGACVDILIETQKRLDEIRRRLIPPHQPVDAKGPWSDALGAELQTLREWRLAELTRAVGAEAGRKLDSSLGYVQLIPTVTPLPR